MIRAACHCGAARFEMTEAPAWVLDCNCTLCRRYGALWSYYPGDDQAKLLSIPDAGSTETYMWNDREIAFHRCRTCGCVTHMGDARDGSVYGVNARMMVGLDPTAVRLRQVDNGWSGHFWTKADEPPIKSRHPYMPPPGPDDWR
jgi:hypothetical protein